MFASVLSYSIFDSAFAYAGIVSLTIPLIEDNVTGTNHQLPLEGIVALTILRMNIMITRTNLQLPLEIVMKATFDLYAKIITSQYALK